MYNPSHPGEVLKELCLEPLGLTVTEVARELGIQWGGLYHKKSLIRQLSANDLAGLLEIEPQGFDPESFQKAVFPLSK